MFELEKSFTFEAGHVLPHHEGLCRFPHGHSYILKIRLRGKELIQTGPKTNMLLDFFEITEIVKPMLFEFLDHKWLNDSLHCESPTVEFIAKWIHDYLKPKLPALYAVTLHETATSKATYYSEI